MSSNTPLTDSINNLTTYANSVTGASDTNLSDAVATLASGYGGGGGYSVDDLASRNYNLSNITLTGNSVKAYAFAGANVSGTVTAPNVTVIDPYAFQKTKITRAYFPLVASNDIRDLAFENTLLTQIAATDFPKVTACRQSAFQGCQQLVSVVFPSFNGTNGNNVFNNCKNLEIADLGTLAATGNSAFYGCSKLTTIILRRTSGITAMSHSNALGLTPFASGGTGGTIYAPSALIDTYKSATNWSTYEGYGTITWVPIEGSVYETQYADGTPIT